MKLDKSITSSRDIVECGGTTGGAAVNANLVLSVKHLTKVTVNLSI